MGAFEDFVNANLGIRKPLITDTGAPSGSSKAAGIVGSQYLDSNNNFLYEKTGENNTLDWAKICELGEARGGGGGGGTTSGNFSTSVAIPSGVTYTGVNFSSLGNSYSYTTAPQVVASMRFSTQTEFFYGYSTYNVNTTGFNLTFTDTITETGHFLDLVINKDSS